MMKKYLTLLFFCGALLGSGLAQQEPELPRRAYELYPTLVDMDGYAVGAYGNWVLILGGKVRSDVPEIYSEDFPNTDLILIDLELDRASAYTSANLDGPVGEQFASTGMGYHQEGRRLYLLGGYGYSETYRQFMTFPYLTVVDLPATIEALLAGNDPVAHLFQLCDERFALFNGTLDYNGQDFFLIHGNYAFELRPFEENPTYQEETYREQVRTFGLKQENGEWEVTDFRIWYDLEELREYFGTALPERILRELDRLLPPPPIE